MVDKKEIFLGYKMGVSKTTNRPYTVLYFGYKIDKNGFGVGTYNKMFSGDIEQLDALEVNQEVSCTFDRYGNVLSIE